MTKETNSLINVVEALLMAADKPLAASQLIKLLPEAMQVTTAELKEMIKVLQDSYQDKAVELKEVASGYRFQIRQEFADYLSPLWQEKPPRFSRALLETLVLVAYRQPITRGEVEDVRGVAVSTNIMKTLLERDWVKIVGHRDVPGKPALYATTKAFLDYFNLKSLQDLPSLAEIKNLDQINLPLELEEEVSTPQLEAEQGQVVELAEEEVIAVAEEEHLAQAEPELEVILTTQAAEDEEREEEETELA